MNIVGIDEAGRGCWAGPLVCAAVMLVKPLSGLSDSKLLSRVQRETLFEQILANALVGIGIIEAKEIDQSGLTVATQKAMQAALNQIGEYEEVIIDGNYNYLSDNKKVRVMPKADLHVPVVSAASIIAKVTRDRLMFDAAKKFPQYQFDRHVGYGTKLHLELLKLHGVCELHRQSYKPIQALL